MRFRRNRMNPKKTGVRIKEKRKSDGYRLKSGSHRSFFLCVIWRKAVHEYIASLRRKVRSRMIYHAINRGLGGGFHQQAHRVWVPTDIACHYVMTLKVDSITPSVRNF